MVGVVDSETGLPSLLPSSSGSITTWGQQRPSIAPSKSGTYVQP